MSAPPIVLDSTPSSSSTSPTTRLLSAPWWSIHLPTIPQLRTICASSPRPVRAPPHVLPRSTPPANGPFIVGRDKLFRTVQYFARFYAWYLLRTNALSSSIAPWNALKKQLALVRRALRLGKNVEHFQAAAKAADAKQMDPVLKFCAIGRQLGYAIYLTCDMGTYVSCAARSQGR